MMFITAAIFGFITVVFAICGKATSDEEKQMGMPVGGLVLYVLAVLSAFLAFAFSIAGFIGGFA